jgi:hypothetical protein
MNNKRKMKKKKRTTLEMSFSSEGYAIPASETGY